MSVLGEYWIGVKALSAVERVNPSTQLLPVQPEGSVEVNVTAELNKLLPADARAHRKKIPVRIFVSYAHEDERHLKRLDALLDVLEQHQSITAWRDRRLIAGDEWDAEIRRRLEEMDIFLFIASASSLTRPYIRDPEIRRAKERYEKGQVEIVTVKLEPCACDEDPFLGKLQRLSPKIKSVAEWRQSKSIAWEQIRKDLLPVIRWAMEKKTQTLKKV